MKEEHLYKKPSSIMLGLVFIIIFTPLKCPGQVFQFFSRNITLEILPQEIFQQRFGANTALPRPESEILALARRLYPTRDAKRLRSEQRIFSTRLSCPEMEDHWRCGEEGLGLLLAALQDPMVSDLTRRQVDEIINASLPVFNRIRVIGHFKFFYTTNRNLYPDDAVTDTQIDLTAAELNRYWDLYAADFVVPGHYLADGQPLIDIQVHALSGGVLGRTASQINIIELDSRNCVGAACYRKIVTAHELFHRVQYSYNFISGTALMGWMTEGSAKWSEKYTNPANGTYIAFMNQGLTAPDQHLLQERSYNACHFWVYLQRLAQWEAVKEAWESYAPNGHNGLAAVEQVTKTRLGMTFERFIQRWIKANYLKDLDNAPSTYHYGEDSITKLGCNPAPDPPRLPYGPLSPVPITKTVMVTPNATQWISGSVKPYGADYYEFAIGGNLTDFKVNVKGTAVLYYHFIKVKNSLWQGGDDLVTAEGSYQKTLTPGQLDKVILVVGGRKQGGSYVLEINPSQPAPDQTAYLFIHVHNPEGVEISSIPGGGEIPIYAGSQRLGLAPYNRESHDRPFPLSPGAYNLKVEFNGQTKSQTADLRPRERKVVKFVFPRVSYDLAGTLQNTATSLVARLNRSFNNQSFYNFDDAFGEEPGYTGWTRFFAGWNNSGWVKSEARLLCAPMEKGIFIGASTSQHWWLSTSGTVSCQTLVKASCAVPLVPPIPAFSSFQNWYAQAIVRGSSPDPDLWIGGVERLYEPATATFIRALHSYGPTLSLVPVERAAASKWLFIHSTGANYPLAVLDPDEQGEVSNYAIYTPVFMSSVPYDLEGSGIRD